MGEIFDGKKTIYQRGHVIRELTDLIIENPDYFKVCSEIILKFNNDKKYGLSEDLAKLLEKAIERDIKTGKIKGKDAEEFKFLMLQLYRYVGSRGKLLENILSSVGPLYIDTTEKGLNHCRIKNKDGERISEKNYDVVFFNMNNYSAMEELDAELYECKVNVDSYLTMTSDNDLLKRREFFSNTQECLRSSRYIDIAFVTMQSEVDEAYEILNELGFTGIQVLCSKDILQVLEKKAIGQIISCN